MINKATINILIVTVQLENSFKVTPAIRSLFRTDEPQARRCFAVLDGLMPVGKIIVDDPIAPKWGIVLEVVDNSIYLGGDIDAATFTQVFAALRQAGEVLVGMWPDDPRIGFLPPGPVYDGWTLEFYDRPIGEGLDTYINMLPPGCMLKRLDRDSILRTEWGPNDVRLAGGIDIWEKTCLGYGLLQDGEILSEATVGPPALGFYEPGVFTRQEQRGKGYATMVVARLIQEIETMGGQTYWNCARQNTDSPRPLRENSATVSRKNTGVCSGRKIKGEGRLSTDFRNGLERIGSTL
jgi:GNAT superfamily N-acetyltransferase